VVTYKMRLVVWSIAAAPVNGLGPADLHVTFRMPSVTRVETE